MYPLAAVRAVGSGMSERSAESTPRGSGPSIDPAWIRSPKQAFTGVDAGRFAAGIHEGLPVKGGPKAGRASSRGVGVVGLADDLGVRLNGGRAGAGEGPSAIRAAPRTYGVREPMGWDWPTVFDAGDVSPAPGDDEAALRATHERVSGVVGEVLRKGLLPLGLGGGHDLTYALVRPVAQAHPHLAGVYVDAHLDVRERAGSGMPFRRLIEDCGVSELRLLGFNPLVNSREHVSWFQQHGGRFAPGPDTLEHDSVKEWAAALIPSRPCFVSIDLDGIDSTHAPGVSALNPAGLMPKVVAAIARAAGASKHVMCFDVMEMNPRFDVDGRTARLAAHLVLSFLRGVAERTAG